MDCHEHFSVYNLYNSSSLGNEQFITTDCIDNRVKFSLFVINIILYSGILICGLYLLCESLLTVTVSKRVSVSVNTNVKSVSQTTCCPHVSIGRNQTGSLTYKDYTYILISIASLFQIITHVMYICGIAHPARYVVYPIAIIILIGCATMHVKIWYKILASVCADVTITSQLGKKLDRQLITINTLIIISTVLFVIIGPIVFYDNHNIVNWCYVINVSTVAIIIIIFNMVLYSVASKFLDVMNVRTSDTISINTNRQSLLNFVDRLKMIMFAAKFGSLNLIIMIFIPLWMLADLKGVFYYHLTLVQMSYIAGFIFQLRFATRFREGKSTNTGSGSGTIISINGSGGGMKTKGKNSNVHSHSAIITATTSTTTKVNTNDANYSSAAIVATNGNTKPQPDTSRVFSYTVDQLNDANNV